MLVSIMIIFGCYSAYTASNRGRDPVIWAVIGLITGIIGLIVLYCMADLSDD